MFSQVIVKKSGAIILAVMLVASPLANVFAAEDVTVPVINEAPSCNVTVVSDNTTQGGIATFVSAAWTTIAGATWIWSDPEVTDSRVEQTKTFTKTFNWSGPVTDANLVMAADNTFSVTLNGTEVGSSSVEDNFSATHSYNVSSMINPGVNTLIFTVTNLAIASELNDPHGNPAGLDYKLVANGTNPTCDKLPVQTGTLQIMKYMCPADTAVIRSINGVNGTVPEGCVAQAGAHFGYVHGEQTSASEPYPELSGTYTGAGITDNNGKISLSLPASGRYLVSETDSSNTKLSNESILGLYCEGDADTSSNNDNQELTFVHSGQTAHCVAYNPVKKDTGGGEKTTETIVVTGNTAAGENQPGWLFNRDTTSATPFAFNTSKASIGSGSLQVFPIGSNPSDKMIAENFINTPVVDLQSIAYDFLIAGNGTVASAKNFYLSVYTNINSSNNYYDCRFDYVPTTGTVGSFSTAKFNIGDTPINVAHRGTNIASCPATLAGMPMGSYARVFAINVGDTSASDTGLGGNLDKVVVETTNKITTYDFEPADNHIIEGSKFNDANSNGLRDEGEVTIPNWTIELVNSQNDELIMSTTTDSSGHYLFNVPNGSYLVREVEQTGWEHTATIGTGVDGNECHFSFGEITEQTSAKPMLINSNSCDFGNHQITQNQCTVTGNLLANGSFEVPTITSTQGWDIFDSVVNGLNWAVSWINPTTSSPKIAKLELQNGRRASNGSQYAELDSNYTHPGEVTIPGDARVKIAQTIPTIPGNVYTLTYDFSAVPGHSKPSNNKVNIMINGAVLDTQTTSLLPHATTTNWTHQSFMFTATGTTTEVAMEDAGRPDTFGTLIDNVSLKTCVADNNGGGNGGNGDRDVYLIGGNIWHDKNKNGKRDGEGDIEPEIAGWNVTISNGEETLSTTTDASGNYNFKVPAGTWTITQEFRSNWSPTFPTANHYVITVPIPVVMTFLDLIMNNIISTALAADIVQATYTGYNFGDVENQPTSAPTPTLNSNSTGHYYGRSLISSPAGKVLGASTSPVPIGQVLGASTSTLPVGAPNTGAGGTSGSLTDSITMAVFNSNKFISKKKNA